MSQIDFQKEIVNYRNRFLREVIFDLVVKYGKDGIMHILRDIKIDETRKDFSDVFISTEDDGSEWVHLEDYNNLRMAFLISETSLEEQSRKEVYVLSDKKIDELIELIDDEIPVRDVAVTIDTYRPAIREAVRKWYAAEQSLHPTSETLPDLQALSTPEHSATSQSEY